MLVKRMEITSLNNEKVKFWEKLKTKKFRDKERLFLIEDSHLIDEALKINIVKEIITIDSNMVFDVPTYHVTDKIMKLLSEQQTSASLIAVCYFLPEKDIEGNIIILDRIQDPGNLGTIIRSAAAFNFKNIVISTDSVDLYNSKVIRASEGMIFHVNVIRKNIIEFINNLDKEYKVITTSVKNGVDIRSIKASKWAIIIGNEGAGVSDDVSALAQERVLIPMNDGVESLNAGVSASILMYEVYYENLH